MKMRRKSISCIIFFLFFNYFAVLAATSTPPWYQRRAVVPVTTGLADSAAYDVANGNLIVFSDASQSIHIFNLNLDSSFEMASPIMWSLNNTYPNGQYGAIAQNGIVYVCQAADRASSCFKVRVENGQVTQAFGMVPVTGKSFVSMLLTQQQNLLTYSSTNVFYLFQPSMYPDSGQSALELETRFDDYIAGPNLVDDSYYYLFWTRLAIAREDANDFRNFAKIGRFCASPDAGYNFYIEVSTGSPSPIFNQVKNVSLLISEDKETIVISSRSLSSRDILLCYLTKDMIERQFDDAIEQCSQQRSLDPPGFAGGNFHTSCTNSFIRQKVSRGCSPGNTAFFGGNRPMECTSPINIAVPPYFGTIVASTSLQLNSMTYLLVYVDRKGNFVRLLLDKTSDDSFQTTRIGEGSESLNSSVGRLASDEQVVDLFSRQSYNQLVFVTSQRVCICFFNSKECEKPGGLSKTR